MSSRIRITEADLRSLMRDERYWQANNPERPAYSAWVTRNWAALFAANGGSPAGSVWVEPYSRTRDGQIEHIAGHWRSPPRGRESATVNGSEGAILIAAPPRDPRLPPMILEGGPAYGGGSGGGARAPRTINVPPPNSVAASRPGARTPEELVQHSTLERVTMGNTNVRRVEGGLSQLSNDFYGMAGTRPLTQLENGGIVGTIVDGRVIAVRPSADGRPTIDVSRTSANGKVRATHKFRYGSGAE